MNQKREHGRCIIGPMVRRLLLTGVVFVVGLPSVRAQVFPEIPVDLMVTLQGQQKVDQYGIQLTVTRGSFVCSEAPGMTWAFRYQYMVRHITSASPGTAFFRALAIPTCAPFCAERVPEVLAGSAPGGNPGAWQVNQGLSGGVTPVHWTVQQAPFNGMPPGGIWRFTFFTNAMPTEDNQQTLAMNDSHVISLNPLIVPDATGVSPYVFPCGGIPTPLAVRCAVARSALWPPRHDLIDVGLAVETEGGGDPAPVVTVRIYSDEEDETRTGDGRFSPDARPAHAFAPAQRPLRLRAERRGDDGGRVYLIVVTATDSTGAAARECCTVTVPHDQSRAALQDVANRAEAAREYCARTGVPPPGFVPVGDGPVIGPKQ